MSIIFSWAYYTVLILSDVLYTKEMKIVYGKENSLPIIPWQPMVGTNVSTFYNVIAQDGADPWMYKHTDGWYYLTRTTSVDIRIWRSRTFTSIDAGDCFVAWTPPSSGASCSSLWAPELHFIHSSWYIYFTATTCDQKVENHRMFVIENTNPDPFNGSFTFKGQITDATNRWAIDGTVFEHPSGQLYFIWSGREQDADSQQILNIAEMSDPWTVKSARVVISTPTFDWEKVGGAGINEGPEVTILNGVISLVYSASGSSTDGYCLGLITSSTTSDLMNPASWYKHPKPIFESANNVFAPGHHSFTKSPDGTEDWIIYHSARFQGSGWIRQVRAQRFTWNTDSTPNLGQPANRDSQIAIPSGDSVRVRYEAEAARLIDNPRAVPDDTASNHTKVGYIDYPNSTVIFTVTCAKAETYVIVIRDDNGTAGDVTATHWLSINNGTEFEITVVYSGWEMWGATMLRANLVEGVNTLTFRKGNNFAEIDEIDIFPDIA